MSEKSWQPWQKLTFWTVFLLLPIVLLQQFQPQDRLESTPASAAYVTLTPTAVFTHTSPPSPTGTIEATATPTAVSTKSPTSTPTANPSSTPATTPTPTAVSLDWLHYLNRFRAAAGLPLLQNDPALSAGSLLHSEYMARNDNAAARTQQPDNPLFTEAGRSAAWNGNIFAMNDGDATYLWAINFWMSAPFHALPILDPALQTVGYGNYRDDLGRVRVAAVLDVLSGRSGSSAATYPLTFPPHSGQTWITRQTLIEYPEPLTSCPGWRKPAGPPLIVQLGPGHLTPDVTDYSLRRGETDLAVCAFDETTYFNPDDFAQQRGRDILDRRDAVVLIPQRPLEAGQTYTARVEANGQVVEWSFTAVAPPPITAEPIPPADPATWGAFNVGSLEWGGQTGDFQNLALMRSTGMTWLKFQQKWRPDSRPEELAARIQRAHNAGFKVLVSLTGDPYPQAIDFTAFTEFLRGVAALNPPPDAIEVWNEMNIDFEWPAGQIDPEQYVNEMLAPAYHAIKSTNPRILVISGAPAPTGFDNGVNAWSVSHYVTGMADAGAANYLDCVGVHSNEGAVSPYETSGHPAGDYFGWYFQPSMDMYYFAFGGTRPLCITELGILSGDGYDGLPGRFWWARNTSAAEQATWLAEALTIANQSGTVRLAIIFNMDIFHWGEDPQGGYAIIRPGGGCPFCELMRSRGP